MSSNDIARFTDYGLGTFGGRPVVLVSFSRAFVYHRHDHHGKIGGVTFTEDFARNAIGLRPCRSCWPIKREARRG